MSYVHTTLCRSSECTYIRTLKHVPVHTEGCTCTYTHDHSAYTGANTPRERAERGRYCLHHEVVDPSRNAFVFLVLRVDCVLLAVDSACAEERRHKELSQAIQSAFQLVAVHREIVVGVFRGSVGIIVASIGAEVLGVVLFIRILLCP